MPFSTGHEEVSKIQRRMVNYRAGGIEYAGHEKRS
jgi:hypothetical protein